MFVFYCKFCFINKKSLAGAGREHQNLLLVCRLLAQRLDRGAPVRFSGWNCSFKPGSFKPGSPPRLNCSVLKNHDVSRSVEI